MNQLAKTFTLSACALAASLLISACGGGGTGTDTVPPTVAITSAAGTGGAVMFTFNFSEAIKDGTFLVEDVAVAGGTAGALSKVTAMQYTLLVTPTTGAISATVAVGKYSDVANNANTVSATNTYAAVADTGTVLANFDTAVPGVRNNSDTGGFNSIVTTAPAGGGSGSALEVLRNGVTNYALSVLDVTIPFTATRKTLSARVYSPTAGIPMKMKLEGPAGAVLADLAANEAVVVGWQTLTWTFNPDLTKTYNAIVLLPNIGEIDVSPGKKYYFDDITLLPEAGAPAPTPSPTPFVVCGTTEPTCAPTTVIPSGAITIYSEASATAGFNARPDWGQTTQYSEANLASNKSLKYTNLNYEGIEFTAVDVSTKGNVHFDFWSPTITSVNVSLISPPKENAVTKVLVTKGWNSIDIDLSQYNVPDLKAISQIKLEATGGGTLFVDNIYFWGTPSAATPVVAMGAGGPQTLTVATGDVKTGDGGNTMFVAGEGIFAVNYVGSAETVAPFRLAGLIGAKTANFTGLTGIAGGDIGYFQDDVNLSNSSQKVDELGWVTGTSYAPNGVPNFFRTFVLKGAVSNAAYMGLYVNAPNNGTVNASSFSKLKFKVWGPGPMFERTNFTPVLEMTLTGPKVAGCPTGSGGTEITQNVTANLRNGAGGSFTLPFAGFTVKGLCGADTASNAVANVRANLARVVVTVPGTSFNYTNLDGGNYATGVNFGPIGFTNN